MQSMQQQQQVIICRHVSQMDDDYMKARAADVKDISDRLVRVLSGHDEGEMDAAEPSIIVAEDLAPSETVQMDKSKFLHLLQGRFFQFPYSNPCKNYEYPGADQY